MSSYTYYAEGAWRTPAPKQPASYVLAAALATLAGVVAATAVAMPSLFSATATGPATRVAVAPITRIPQATAAARINPDMTPNVNEATTTGSYAFVGQQTVTNPSLIALCIASVVGAVALILRRNDRPEVAPIAMYAASSSKSKAQAATDFVLQMPGIISPTGFFDPAGLSRMKTPEQLRYAREAELKHGRVAMLAALGFPFAEEFHPLFPEDTVPSDFSFQLTPLQTYWPLVVLGVGALETFSIRTFKELNDGTWELRDDHVAGDLGFDPLGLAPKDPEKLLGIQNRELSNGRLAMIAIAGMVAQELAVRADVLQADEKDIESLERLAGITQSIAMFAASGRKF